MKQGRFSEEQIIAVLKEAEAGAKVTELCRRHGISDAAFYTWRKKYGGLEVSEMRRLRQLEEENRRLKAMVADVMTTHELSQRRACGLIGITRRGFQRTPAEDRNRALRQRLRELAEQ